MVTFSDDEESSGAEVGGKEVVDDGRIVTSDISDSTCVVAGDAADVGVSMLTK